MTTNIFIAGDGYYNKEDKEAPAANISEDPVEERYCVTRTSWPSNRLCNCCGAYAADAESDISSPANGILVALNNSTPEMDNEFVSVKHVQTKAGTLVVSVRKKYG